MTAAARFPARSDPANNQLFLLCGASHNRKNFLFLGSDAGGERAATLYSLLGTAKLSGVNPEAYLRHVLTVIADHPVNRVEALTLKPDAPRYRTYEGGAGRTNSKQTIVDREPFAQALPHMSEADLLYLNRMVVERLNLLTQAKSTMQLAQFTEGDRVSLTDNDGAVKTGTTLRLNKKTVSLRTAFALRYKRVDILTFRSRNLLRFNPSSLCHLRPELDLPTKSLSKLSGPICARDRTTSKKFPLNNRVIQHFSSVCIQLIEHSQWRSS